MLIDIIFIVSLVLIAYAYVGYAALVLVLSRVCSRPARSAEILPTVSLIIAAHNEERCIAEKIENSLALDYPADKLEIIVASDCSADGTDRIVRTYASQGVVLSRLTERLGKSVAQNSAAKASNGEILLFSDATTMYRRDAVRMIVRSFADPEVGCVAGRLVYADQFDNTTGQGCRSYWGYETLLRWCESRFGSLIGVSGAIYAVRRSSNARVAHDMSSDFVIATEIHLQGLRTVYEPDAVAVEQTNKRGSDEFRMRVRVIEQTISAIHRYREVLNPLKHGMYAFQMISHKVIRYAVPALLFVALLANVLLANKSIVYQLSLTAQAVFYMAAIVGWCCDRFGIRLGRLGIPYYFTLANAACLVGFLKFARGEAHIVWDPLREPGTS